MRGEIRSSGFHQGGAQAENIKVRGGGGGGGGRNYMYIHVCMGHAYMKYQCLGGCGASDPWTALF